jgi:hypothetical protein
MRKSRDAQLSANADCASYDPDDEGAAAPPLAACNKNDINILSVIYIGHR